MRGAERDTDSGQADRRALRPTRLDDPVLVAAEYADEARLRRRAAAFTGRAAGASPPENM